MPVRRLSNFAILFCVLLGVTRGLPAQQVPAAVISDPAPDKANPPVMEAPDIVSHGSTIHAVLYVASGAGPHPTVVLMHGLPGNEKNLDLAYSIRRAGWNVLVPHYRGSWGSEGVFSFTHALEDMQVFVQFLRDPQNAGKYRIDASRIVLIGHSLGGFMVSHTAARDPQIMAVAMIAPWNIGAAVTRDLKSRSDTFYNGSPRLAGTTPEGMIVEAKQNAAKWNYVDDAPALKDRPVLMVEADDRNISYNQEMVAALRKAGSTQVTEEHLPTDHSFSDHRIALQAVVIEWLQAVSAAKKK